MAINQKIYVTVDALVTANNGKDILLIERGNEPFKGMWALPGGFVEDDEDLHVAAARELCEETGLEIEPSTFRQIGTFGKPDRDPRFRTISVVFHGTIDVQIDVSGADDAAHADWFDIAALPPLAFDHSEILEFFLNMDKSSASFY